MGVGVAVITKSEFRSVSRVRLRLTVFTIGSAGAGGPAGTPGAPSALFASVLPVKLPYDRHSFLWKAKVFNGLFLKQTFPLIGFKSGGMIKSGAGAPGRLANSCVAMSVLRVPPVGGLD